MPLPILVVESLSKKFIIRHEKDGSGNYASLRDYIANRFRSIAKRSNAAMPSEEFWALNDVSFKVEQGDRVGIIGRNGAGKSTLLKILSQITEPTAGKVSIKGRVASLLEVGTGFHPELTGRENIFLNGAILGMSRAEIANKFDEIVAFAETEKFLDTPVKRYSSGMYVRLAFAVAAHLEPEILIVDEVLAVGDAEFQKKCLGKMKDVSEAGRTVVFVSHNMASLLSLCNKGIVLSAGELIFSGTISDSVNAYLNSRTSLRAEKGFDQRKDREGNQLIQFVDSFFIQSNLNHNQLEPGKDAQLVVRCRNKTDVDISSEQFKLDVRINDILETKITWMSTELRPARNLIIGPGADFSFLFTIKGFNLRPGQFNVSLFLVYKGDIADWIMNAFDFEMLNSDFYGNGRSMPSNQGLVLFHYETEIRAESDIS